MMYPELEKAVKIMADLVRDDFRLLTMSVREAKRRLDDAQAPSSAEEEEDGAAEQDPANGKSRNSIAAR
jgi:hypothetical protein